MSYNISYNSVIFFMFYRILFDMKMFFLSSIREMYNLLLEIQITK